ncbi:MAG: hypothetical protein Q4C98_11365 [Capnocytophaga sp.]|nr:hypothetical protein [Capnocytophaga sp.]
MKGIYQINRVHIAFVSLILMYVFCYFLSQNIVFHQNKNLFSNTLSFDLLVSIPVIYFLLIRKTAFSKKSSVLVLIFGIIIGSYIIPTENQTYINIAKKWIVPIIELSLMIFVFAKIFQTIKKYRTEMKYQFDFYTLSKSIFNQIMPNRIANFLATEITVFYYSFFIWKKKSEFQNEFTTHKNSSVISFLGAFIFIILIETITVHLLASQWNTIVAWILTGLSLYSTMTIFGIIKSIIYRRSRVENNEVILYFGILSEIKMNIDDIEKIELITKGVNQEDKSNQGLSPFENMDGYNTVIYLKNEHQINGLYGFQRKCKNIRLKLDDNQKFKELIFKNKNSKY